MSVAPVKKQPGGQGPPGGWMEAPSRPSGCPPGLEYLTQIDQVLAHQQVELWEAFTGWETENKYAIKNSMGQQIFFAVEESSCCGRMCCANQREFTIHIIDNNNKEVMKMFRPYKYCASQLYASCANCFAQEVIVEAPPGNIIGYVKQRSSCCTLQLEIQDADGTPNMWIDGPCMCCTCCSDIEFPVYGDKACNQKVGAVTKQWSGLAKEMFTQADNFGVTFPMDMDVKSKATMFGAMFLIDFMVFEKKGDSSGGD